MVTWRLFEESSARLREVGLDTPNWEALAGGLRPGPEEREREPCQVGHKKFVSQAVHEHHRVNVVWPQLSPDERALVRSQSGPLSSVPFTPIRVQIGFRAIPCVVAPPSPTALAFHCGTGAVCACRCGRPLDAFGHHHRRASFQEGLCNRECHRSDISGGWSQGVHERDGEGPWYRVTTQE